MSNEFEPKIIGFLCNWCAYAEGDLAGVIRAQYLPNMRPIRVMCSGMVHPDLVMEAFKHGADGVIIMGCHVGQCHYNDGNSKALARGDVIKIVLEDMGVEPERFAIVWVSSAEGQRFAGVINDFTEKIIKLGHNPLKT
jgi:F420-non-reducing hydrogenase iron-sulfur subunit